MPILAAELLFYKSAVVSDASTNGGRMSANIITDAVKNNIFPDVPEAERTAGSTKHRKVFLKVANDADLSLLTPRMFIETHTPGDDAVTFFVGTQTDTQTDLTGSERVYGAGQLNADVIATDTVIVAATEDGEGAGLTIFLAGDTIRISDKTSVTDAGNNEEFHTILTAVYAGDLCTITLDGTSLSNGYAAAATKITSIYEPGTVVSTVDTLVVTSAAGTFSALPTANFLVDNIGGIEQDWTLTFTSGTAFNVSGNTIGSAGTGTISTTTAPNNTDFTKPYWQMLSAGFGGTFLSGDTITFSTRPANVPLWLKRIVPAGASALGNNNFIIAVDGESS